MTIIDKASACVVLAVALLTSGSAFAVSPAQKCQAAKLKITGKYAFCRLKVDAKAVKTGQPADYTICAGQFETKFSDAETKAVGMCATQGDLGGVEAQVSAATTAFKKLQARWVDNGDGTVSDTQTGLMWEKKDNLDGTTNLSDPHDADNLYTWATSGTSPNGTAYTDFLGTLNNDTSPDGTTISGCFAGHCDWRLPTSAELEGIVELTAPGCGMSNPCIDAVFGPTVAGPYWSSTTYSSGPALAYRGDFLFGGSATAFGKATSNNVRAVRGGS